MFTLGLSIPHLFIMLQIKRKNAEIVTAHFVTSNALRDAQKSCKHDFAPHFSGFL